MIIHFSAFKGLFWGCSICSLTISSALFLECVEAIINRYHDKKELAGVDIAEVNRTVKQFEQMKKMQKQLNGMMKNKKRNNMFGGLKLWQ